MTGAAILAASSERANLDRAAVELGRNDPLASVDPGRLARVRSALFGASYRYALADPRLEALRRYAVLYRTRVSPAASLELSDQLTEDDRQRVRALVDAWGAAPLREPDVRQLLTPTALAFAAVYLIGTALL